MSSRYSNTSNFSFILHLKRNSKMQFAFPKIKFSFSTLPLQNHPKATTTIATAITCIKQCIQTFSRKTNALKCDSGWKAAISGKIISLSGLFPTGLSFRRISIGKASMAAKFAFLAAREATNPESFNKALLFPAFIKRNWRQKARMILSRLLIRRRWISIAQARATLQLAKKNKFLSSFWSLIPVSSKFWSRKEKVSIKMEIGIN